MPRPRDYIGWANRMFGSVSHNLAKAGVRSLANTIGTPVVWDDSTAWTRLRHAVASFNGTAVEEVLPALGTTHALWLAFAGLLEPSDEVLIESPAYEPLWSIPQRMGATVRRFRRAAANGYRLDVDAIAAEVTERVKAVVVTSPHNPTGVRDSREELAALARACSLRGATLVVDEVYAPWGDTLSPDGTWGQTTRHLSSNIVAVSGLTKAYGLGALRVGWLLGPEDVIRRSQAALVDNVGDAPIAQSCLARHAFECLPAIAREANVSVEGSQARVSDWLSQHPHLRWHEPERALFGWVTVPDALDLTDIIERGAAQCGVLVAPGSYFDTPNAFRLGWSLPPADLDEALSRLGRVVAPLQAVCA